MQYAFANYLEDAKSKVIQFDLDGNFIRDVKLPGIGSARGFSAKAIEKELYYSFNSYVYPNTTFKYEIESGISEIYEKPKVDF